MAVVSHLVLLLMLCSDWSHPMDSRYLYFRSGNRHTISLFVRKFQRNILTYSYLRIFRIFLVLWIDWLGRIHLAIVWAGLFYLHSNSFLLSYLRSFQFRLEVSFTWGSFLSAFNLTFCSYFTIWLFYMQRKITLIFRNQIGRYAHIPMTISSQNFLLFHCIYNFSPSWRMCLPTSFANSWTETSKRQSA